ncbi:SagB/ThcOx family dehydrogenase [Clostridium botulinum]|uniref:SagB/ThcOx family dehydrogenase n=2 Tax=Clostridium botulinum TaxID=1491 RepID=A0A846I7A4_CLOBO|nr:SagB family peptide dehydrogenase [Clostridium botulinum]ACQ54414.1 streptolysin associated protein SagB [Clostridium botulinum Ba4 str. 657]AJE10168.1 SagB-type dehydrogenase domain protein [Clostridium botulinum CDC_1436]AXG92273.1 SagB/ThcOx family dehydrogenase [Clostridium botulinum]EDT87372.1 streptolysin associated protein SagB [Clostridium botulinum Bf]MBY6757249.1 SagB family peptide dehydrogenase [Clostridium botulinum]
MLLKNLKKQKIRKQRNTDIENKMLVHFNTQYSSISPYVDNTVVKTPDTIIKGSLYSKDNRFLSEEYLLNYRTNNDNLGFRMGVSSFFQKDAALTFVNLDMGEDGQDIIGLPPFKNIRVGLSTAIKSRRSVRRYSSKSMSLNDVANIFYYTQGICDEVEPYNLEGNKKKIKLRANPSAGGLYPIELYVYMKSIKDLEDGIYTYYPYSHGLKPIKVNKEALKIENFAEFGVLNAENANLIVFYVYNFLKNSRKYGDAGFSYALIETGEMAQNLQLVSTALGYGACDIGGYEKQYIEEVLDIDGVLKHVVHMTVVGWEQGD